MTIPNGDITFLFTDIEGSTQLAQEFPDSIQATLEKHYAVISKAFESNNGFVFDVVGDGFCCAFEKADDAIRAAVVAQLNLKKEKWNDGVIKVRIGIHSGNAAWDGKRYIGYITLARSARIMSAAYGEQIIISNNTYVLTKNKLHDKEKIKISFRDLGERRLKDLIQPVRLFQVLTTGLREDFPPLKTLDARPNNLPVQLTSFIGRESEMKHVKDLLKNTRLLTLTGSGGSGKTRLAMQIAADVIDDFANGVWFAELASISEPELLPQAMIQMLGLKEESQKSPEDTLCEYLMGKEILIIFDNCEHLIEQCAELAERLLSSSQELKIIATSREALLCSGEQTHRVLSLDTPDPKNFGSVEKLSQYEAVRLFIERALAVNADFRVNNDNAPALAAICHRLDGIPLAIELAAARTKVLTVEKINKRLNDRFGLLTGGKRTALPRQQTLRALIDWSYDLLTEKEKVLWRRLSVFSGGWTLEAAEEVCSDEKINTKEMLELLNQLTGKSIIIFEAAKERYRILESLKQYGEEKLRDLKEYDDIFSKHLKYFMEFAEKANPKLRGIEDQVCLKKLEFDHGNFKSAIEWSAGKDLQNEKGARLAAALCTFWDIRGHYSTGRCLIRNILRNTNGIIKSTLGKILSCAGSMTLFLGEFEKARNYFEEGLVLLRDNGDKNSIADSLNGLGNVEMYLGNYEQAKKFFEENFSVGKELGQIRILAVSMNNLGNIEYIQGNYDMAQKLYEDSLKYRRKIGNKHGIAIALLNLGNIALDQGNFEQAHKMLEESLTLCRETEDARLTANALNALGNLECFRGNYEKAKKLTQEGLKLNREIGDKRSIPRSLNNLGIIEYLIGNFETARKFHEESLLLTQELSEKSGIAETLNNLGNLAFNMEDYKMAKNHYKESLKLRLELGEKSGIIESIVGYAAIMISEKNSRQSVTLLGAVESSLKSIGRVLELNEQKFQEGIIKLLYEETNPEEFLKYFEEGKKLSLEQAVSMIND